MKWEKCKLSDICDIRYGKDNKKIKNGNIPVFGSGGIIRYVDTAIHQKKSVLIPRKGTLSNLFFVKQPFWTVDTLFWTDIYDEIIIPEFLFYSLKTMDLASKNVGTAVPSLTTKLLNDLEIALPPFEEQKRIVAVLSALDDKIEVNRKINDNLEQQAQALFKSWFVDFAPWGGQMPGDWQIGNLLDIADYTNGLAMQKFRPVNSEQGLPVLKIRELHQGNCDKKSELCSPSIKSDYIITDGDVIFSWSGSLMIDIWCGGICGLNQHLFKVTSKIYDKWFYYLWTDYHLERFISIASDKATTMGHIKREELSKAQIYIPSCFDYDKMNVIIKPIYDLIIANKIENKKLIKIRDAMLPMLMSGEISNINC